MAVLIIEILGWIGMLLITSAYFIVLYSKKITENSKIYNFMNLFGAILIIINSFYNGAYPSVGLNFVWSITAIYGIIKGLKK